MLTSQASERLDQLLEALCCPNCRSELVQRVGRLDCGSCGTGYRIVDGVIELRPTLSPAGDELQAWSSHWSDERQRSVVQRFFSFYRKAVFARTVRYFIGRYFPPTGLFVEAGSGTAETSMRIDKHDGKRTLVAVDLVLPVLARCHPIMDARVCGDLFRLPFRDDSLDGVWNVGVMEHFTPGEIDAALRELHRVLRPGGRIFLLWPGTDSVPQKLLRLVEKLVNLRGGERFQFHPDEISQLRSLRQGRQILAGNGFEVVATDYGWFSLLAFKALVGKKPSREFAANVGRR